MQERGGLRFDQLQNTKSKEERKASGPNLARIIELETRAKDGRTSSRSDIFGLQQQDSLPFSSSSRSSELVSERGTCCGRGEGEKGISSRLASLHLAARKEGERDRDVPVIPAPMMRMSTFSLGRGESFPWFQRLLRPLFCGDQSKEERKREGRRGRGELEL